MCATCRPLLPWKAASSEGSGIEGIQLIIHPHSLFHATENCQDRNSQAVRLLRKLEETALDGGRGRTSTLEHVFDYTMYLQKENSYLIFSSYSLLLSVCLHGSAVISLLLRVCCLGLCWFSCFRWLKSVIVWQASKICKHQNTNIV